VGGKKKTGKFGEINLLGQTELSIQTRQLGAPALKKLSTIMANEIRPEGQRKRVTAKEAQTQKEPKHTNPPKCPQMKDENWAATQRRLQRTHGVLAGTKASLEESTEKEGPND